MSRDTYAGGKGGSGVVQQIINQLVPHDVYISAFAGHDAVFCHIKPARIKSILIDMDPAVVAWWAGVPGAIVIHGDAISFLRSYDWKGGELVYADPPYLKVDVDGRRVRKTQTDIYTHEFCTVEQHTELLSVLRSLPCSVAVSGYWSKLYGELLHDWRYISFNAQTRGGTTAREFLWLNYPEPFELHDYRYLGINFREREKITRQKKRWIARLQRMSSLQRYAMLDVIDEYKQQGKDG